MPGLVPGIHVFVSTSKKDVDGRDKPGHDEPIESARFHRLHFRAGLSQSQELRPQNLQSLDKNHDAEFVGLVVLERLQE